MVEKDIPKHYLNVLKEIESHIPELKKIKLKYDLPSPEFTPEYVTSNKFLFELINNSGPWHSGQPGHLYSTDWTISKLVKDDNNSVINITRLFEKLALSLMCRRPALSTLYPPGGYIGWHHNGDIPGRNILFSWSEKGDGVFRLYNNKLNNFEEYPDSPGWNIKSLKFYSHLESAETGYSWHAMRTNCFRLSFGFILTDELWNDSDQIHEVLEEDLQLKNKSLNGAWF